MEKEIFTKSIHKEIDPNEGRRISVMSRHTLNDGKTPDARIIEGVTFDEWKKEFAPPDKLVGAYYRGELPWDDFEEKYKEYLRIESMRPLVEAFAKRCAGETITLMCTEESEDKCHRRILAEELQKYQPDLKIYHK